MSISLKRKFPNIYILSNLGYKLNNLLRIWLIKTHKTKHKENPDLITLCCQSPKKLYLNIEDHPLNMYDSTSQLFQDFLGDFYSRRLLLHNPNYQIPSSASPPVSVISQNSSEQYTSRDNSFDANVVMVLSFLLCALICSLGLNSIVKCALHYSNLVASESSTNSPVRRANKGIKKKALKTFPIVNYSAELNFPSLDTECIICLSEFTTGERVRLLPKCNHGFHVHCIDKWLSKHSSCPKCRHNLMETCQNIVGYSQATPSESAAQVQERIIIIAPLEPEGFIRNYQESS